MSSSAALHKNALNDQTESLNKMLCLGAAETGISGRRLPPFSLYKALAVSTVQKADLSLTASDDCGGEGGN